MTVKELRKLLRGYPNDMEVATRGAPIYDFEALQRDTLSCETVESAESKYFKFPESYDTWRHVEVLVIG